MVVDSKWSKVKFQLLATIAGNICVLGQGTAIGWMSPSLPQLVSDQSPLASGPLSVDEAAWIGGIVALSAVAGTTFFGFVSNYIGSRNSVLLCGFPLMVSWLLVLVATQPWHLMVARTASGLTGGGVFLCLPMFVAEIADDFIRGQLSSLMQLSFNVGILLGYIIGSSISYSIVPAVLIALPITFFCAFIWLPNSPQYLLKSNQPKKAEKSLRFYRNCPTANKRDDQKLTEELTKFATIAEQNANMPTLKMAEFFTAEALRGLIIGPTLMACAQFSGTFTISNYAGTIFRKSGSTLDPNLSAIFMGCTQVIGTVCTSSFIDRLGRKVLLLISAAGSALTLLVTGVYSFLSVHGYDVSALNLLPVISVSAFIFISAVGITPIPYVLVAEVLPPRIRRVGSTICVCSVSAFAFIMLRFFPMLMQALDLYGCMFLFAAFSCVGFLFTLFVVKETKGINLDQIAESK